MRFEVVGWNHLYYGAHKDHAAEARLLEQLLTTRPDIEADRAHAHAPRVQLQRALRAVGAGLPFLLRWLADPSVRQTVEETERYFDQRQDIGRDVREVLKQLLRPALDAATPVLLIGHSLGSVIAWDALWELTHEEGRTGELELMTLGSPLGLRFVQQRLLGHDCTGAARYPHLIGSWHNIAAVGDLVALDPTLADDFKAMRRLGLVERIVDHHRGIYNHYRDANGLNPHRSYGYLVNPVVATRVAGWLWRNGQR